MNGGGIRASTIREGEVKLECGQVRSLRPHPGGAVRLRSLADEMARLKRIRSWRQSGFNHAFADRIAHKFGPGM